MKFCLSKYLLIIFILIFFNNKNLPQSLEEGIFFLSKTIANKSVCNSCGNDLEKIDSLYNKAVIFFNKDTSDALLALTFATLPFQEMKINIPIIGVIPLKLPSVKGELFFKKRKNLFGNVFFDSPKTNFGDKDKVAHFFGNAFLGYSSNFLNPSKFLGVFVELFEDRFKSSNGVDRRDLQSNLLGELFGKSLKNNSNILPSDCFKIYSLFYFLYN